MRRRRESLVLPRAILSPPARRAGHSSGFRRASRRRARSGEMLDRPGDWQIVWEPERVIPGHFKTVQAWRMLYHFKSHIELWWNELTGKYEYRAPDPKA